MKNIIIDLVNEQIVTPLQPLIQKRNGLSDQRKRLQVALEQYMKRKESLESERTKILKESMGEIGQGKKPSSEKALQKIKDDLSEAESWILELGQNGIPETEKFLKEVETELETKEGELINNLKPDVANLFEEQIGKAIDLWDAWHEEISNLKNSTGVVRFAKNPFDVRTTYDLTLKDSRLNQYINFIRGF